MKPTRPPRRKPTFCEHRVDRSFFCWSCIRIEVRRSVGAADDEGVYIAVPCGHTVRRPPDLAPELQPTCSLPECAPGRAAYAREIAAAAKQRFGTRGAA